MTPIRWTACTSNDGSWWFEPRHEAPPKEDSVMVLASDYDALAAELAELRRLDSIIVQGLSDRIAQLEAALREIISECGGPDDWIGSPSRGVLERAVAALAGSALDRKGEPT